MHATGELPDRRTAHRDHRHRSASATTRSSRPRRSQFLAELHDRFAGTRHDLLAVRLQTRVDAANGRDPKFLPETESIRNDADWRVAGAGPGLEDRRVEITGPTDRKMAINALNSGAKVWLADQEDATSPTWANVIEGQLTPASTPCAASSSTRAPRARSTASRPSRRRRS